MPRGQDAEIVPRGQDAETDVSLVDSVMTPAKDTDQTMSQADRVTALRPRLLAIARSMRVRDPEDLVQSTLELAIRHSSQLRDDEKLWPWLVAIQAHEAFRWSRRVRETVGWPQTREPASHDLELFAELRDALDSLPPRMRASIVLHHMAGLTVAETAHALGTSENTVKSQLRLGLQRLKESMT